MLDGTQITLLNDSLLKESLEGLGKTQKQLSPKWFYDLRGSELFEEITKLPEYYPTRTETGILEVHAQKIAGLVQPGGALVELGAGASVKTRMLLDAGEHFGAYVPLDISEDFLLETALGLKARYPKLPIHPVVGDFNKDVPLPNLLDDVSKVAFFPGSTIGNLERCDAVALLARIGKWPKMDALILGVDLIKGEQELISAYDDAAGVTAAFNLNLLTRLNNEAGANFHLSAFRHEARWCGDRIEMHLVSTREQVVSLGGKNFSFATGESIHTESSRKYSIESLNELAESAGWYVDETLTDSEQKFLVAVLRK